MIFNYDDEQNILNQVLTASVNTLLLHGNSFERKLLRFFQNAEDFTANNGHEALPPDYYSETYNIMFDVTRINDTEIKKGYNPHFIREREMQKKAISSRIIKGNETAVIYDAENEEKNEHCYKNYKKMARRVFEDHINKIPKWIKQFPKIKYKGLLIFDETECFFEGEPKLLCNNKIAYKPLKLHKPWNDKNLMEKLYDSELDFVVWLCPYKQFNEVVQKFSVSYPSMVIVDLRFRSTNYEKYQEEKLVS